MIKSDTSYLISDKFQTAISGTLVKRSSSKLAPRKPGADPGYFLGGGAPLRNDVTDGEVKKIKSECVYTKKKASSQGGVAHPLPLSP